MIERGPYKKGWPRHNLARLTEFLDSQHPDGYTLRDLEQRMGMKQQNISQSFRRDDMKLSKAERIARTYGYRLLLFFPEWERPYPDSLPPKKEYPNAGNLSGLVKYMRDRNITISHMAQRIGHAPNVLSNAFTKGDILLSTLREITDNLKIEVIWSFEPLNEKKS